MFRFYVISAFRAFYCSKILNYYRFIISIFLIIKNSLQYLNRLEKKVTITERFLLEYMTQFYIYRLLAFNDIYYYYYYYYKLS
jgi:hypothetical protein